MSPKAHMSSAHDARMRSACLDSTARASSGEQYEGETRIETGSATRRAFSRSMTFHLRPKRTKLCGWEGEGKGGGGGEVHEGKGV